MQAQKTGLHEAFMVMDTDDSGTVSFAEFQKWYYKGGKETSAGGRGSCARCMTVVFEGEDYDAAVHQPKTDQQKRRHDNELDERMLREPFSVLYAMNDEHTCALPTS